MSEGAGTMSGYIDHSGGQMTYRDYRDTDFLTKHYGEDGAEFIRTIVSGERQGWHDVQPTDKSDAMVDELLNLVGERLAPECDHDDTEVICKRCGEYLRDGE